MVSDTFSPEAACKMLDEYTNKLCGIVVNISDTIRETNTAEVQRLLADTVADLERLNLEGQQEILLLKGRTK